MSRKFKASLAQLAKRGPLATVSVTVGDDMADYLERSHMTVPTPRSVTALIDTGAQWSTVPARLAMELGIPEADERMAEDFSGALAIYPVYPIKFLLPDGKPRAEVFALGTRESPFREFQCLIGRDLLARGSLVYLGRKRRYMLRI